MPAEIYHVPFPHVPFGVTVNDSLRAIDMLFRADIEPDRVRRHRAGVGARRRRFHPGAGGASAGATKTLRPARHFADCR